MPHILLVEDEPSLADPLAFLLEREGYSVTIIGDGAQAVSTFNQSGADLVLLDLMLPGLPGTEVCRAIRQTSAVPIIMLTAKDSEIDIVVGLELGADDYITKPYSARELLARVRAILRRVETSPTTSTAASTAAQAANQPGTLADQEPSDVLELHGIRLDPSRYAVSVNGTEINMPLREFELLQVLMQNAGKVLTRSQLITLVWGTDYYGDTKTLDVHVKRIRSRIENNPREPELIHTLRGVGYRFG